jgi:protein SCO1
MLLYVKYSAFALCFGLAAAASVFGAEKLPRALEEVGITEHLGAQVDLNLVFRDEQGRAVPLRSVVNGRRPVLLFLAYYSCPNLCGLFLNGANDVLKQLEWTPGEKFQIITVSIDPREEPKLAAKKKEGYVAALGRPEAGAGWHFWVDEKTAKDTDPTGTSARRLADQVGFKYRWDDESQQYAHTAAIIALTPDGKVSRYLYGIAFEPRDVRLALVEAGGRKIGGVMDRILLFCFNYDPRTRKYSLYATNLMRAGGGFTALLVGGMLFAGWRRRRTEHV